MGVGKEAVYLYNTIKNGIHQALSVFSWKFNPWLQEPTRFTRLPLYDFFAHFHLQHMEQVVGLFLFLAMPLSFSFTVHIELVPAEGIQAFSGQPTLKCALCNTLRNTAAFSQYIF